MLQVTMADEFPYRFYEPRMQPFLIWAIRLYLNRWLRRRQDRVEEIDIAGVERLAPLLKTGDGVLLAPNHPDHADPSVMFELGRRLGMPFYYMAAYQLFTGWKRWVLPRLGAFPVDREGTDITAFKTGVNLLAAGKNPLVIFPEGEVYRLAERLTPLREGAVAIAAAAAKKLKDVGKTVWIVPVALKYRYLDRADPLPSLHALMETLERRFTWWPQDDKPLVERIYHYAGGVLGLKEYEYLGTCQSGSLKERIARLPGPILDRIGLRRVGKTRSDTVPVRANELRGACVDALADPKTTPGEKASLRRDLHDLIFCIQAFSYPGDYVRESPTLERVSETLMKFEEDFLGVKEAHPHGPRRAVVRLGEPIDVGAWLTAAGKPRQAVSALTAELEARLQALLDTIPPGRLIEASTPAPKAGTQWPPAEAPRPLSAG